MNNQEIISIAGTFVFGVSGTMVASQRKLDVFGITFVAAVSALGGGTVRDILIGHYPLTWVRDHRLIVTVIVAVAFALLIAKHLNRIKKIIFIIDSIGIGMFTVLGTQYCLDLGLSYFISIIFGVLSVILGGMLRDVICNEIPMILREEWNATVAAIGAIIYITFVAFQWNGWFPMITSMTIIVILRLLSKKIKPMHQLKLTR